MISLYQKSYCIYTLNMRSSYKNQILRIPKMWNKITNFFNKPSSQNSNTNANTNFSSNSANYNSNADYCQAPYQQQQNHGGSVEGVSLLKKLEEGKKVVAVIATFCSGSSYDHLFTSVQQKAQEGTQVLVYSCTANSVQAIADGFNNPSKNEIIAQMIKHIKSLDPDCVVFNWECSSGYSSQSFNEGSKNVLTFAKAMIDRGHMVMFSDFSLKALIAQWDQKTLGPNPFVKVNQFGGNFKLEFDPKVLAESPSAQLQIIGEMAAVGHCNVQAMGGTIVYGVDKKKADTDLYKLQILTIVTSIQGNDSYLCQINGKKGMAGHVLLTYKNGGHLLVSMGHWIQLMKVDTSDKVLFEVAAREYGAERAQQMQMEYANLANQCEKQEYVSRNAVQFVQSSAPCANMSKKARSKY